MEKLSLDEAIAKFDDLEYERDEFYVNLDKACEAKDYRKICELVLERYSDKELIDLAYENLRGEADELLINLLEEIVYGKRVIKSYFDDFHTHRLCLDYLIKIAEDSNDLNSTLNYLGLMIIKYDEDLKYYKYYKRKYPKEFRLNKELIIKQLDYPNYILIKFATYNKDINMGLRLLNETNSIYELDDYLDLLSKNHFDRIEGVAREFVLEYIHHKIKCKQDALDVFCYLRKYYYLTKDKEATKELFIVARNLYQGKARINNGLDVTEDELYYLFREVR